MMTTPRVSTLHPAIPSAHFAPRGVERYYAPDDLYVILIDYTTPLPASVTIYHPQRGYCRVPCATLAHV